MARGFDFRPRNLIQNPDLQRTLRQKLDLKEMSSAPTLAPELQAVIVVSDLTKDPSQHSLIRPTYSSGLGAPAVAAQAGYAELVNPAGSGVLIRMRRCICSVQTGNPGGGFRLGFVTSGNAPNASGQSQDLVNHLGTSGIAKAQLRFGTQAPLVPTMAWAESFGVPIVFDFTESEWVIPPLSIPRGFYAESTILNAAVAYTFVWTEEPLPAPING